MRTSNNISPRTHDRGMHVQHTKCFHHTIFCPLGRYHRDLFFYTDKNHNNMCTTNTVANSTRNVHTTKYMLSHIKTF